MDRQASSARRRVSLYWVAWSVLVAVVFSLRFTSLGALPPFRGLDPVFVLPIGTFILIGAVACLDRHDLIPYLKQHHPERWKQLTSGPGFGPGGHNGVRVGLWVLSGDDMSDPILATIKAEARRFSLFAFVAFLSLPVFMALLG